MLNYYKGDILGGCFAGCWYFGIAGGCFAGCCCFVIDNVRFVLWTHVGKLLMPKICLLQENNYFCNNEQKQNIMPMV